MALVKAGVWHTTIWVSRTWQENLWLEYGAPIVGAVLVPRRKQWIILQYWDKLFLKLSGNLWAEGKIIMKVVGIIKEKAPLRLYRIKHIRLRGIARKVNGIQIKVKGDMKSRPIVFTIRISGRTIAYVKKRLETLKEIIKRIR